MGLYKYRPGASYKIPVHPGFREPEQSHSLREAFIVTHDSTVPADISRGNSGSGVEGQALSYELITLVQIGTIKNNMLKSSVHTAIS